MKHAGTILRVCAEAWAAPPASAGSVLAACVLSPAAPDRPISPK